MNIINALTIEEFVSGTLQFESQYANNVDMIKSQLFHQQNVYKELLEQCQKYEVGGVGENGFYESSKFYVEIANVQLINQEGTEEIILTLYYNGKQKEKRQKYSSNGNVVFNTPFEFNAVSKKENVKIHLQGDTGYGYIY